MSTTNYVDKRITFWYKPDRFFQIDLCITMCAGAWEPEKMVRALMDEQ
jgi:hypothetical protein